MTFPYIHPNLMVARAFSFHLYPHKGWNRAWRNGVFFLWWFFQCSK